MPITEVVRVLASAPGPEGGVDLVYDTDGHQGPDEQARGWPRFWLRGRGCELGPFDDEQAAIDAAAERGVRFGAGGPTSEPRGSAPVASCEPGHDEGRPMDTRRPSPVR
jgi:hypothetical protein